MAEKIKKGIPWFLISALVGLTVIVGFNFGKLTTKADDLGTSVTVGNDAPSFDVVPADSSDGTNPTNVGSDTTFTATATDANGEDYYLAICKENSITPATDGPPTCGGAGSWCISSATTSGNQASCARTALVGDAESNIWYGFVCDKHAGEAGLCSSNSNAASPFKVNHRPSFTVYADDSPKDPNVTVTWTTTASDSDTDTSSDTVTLYVCKTNSFTAPSTCNGGEWCHSSASASDPTCNTTTPRPDGDYDAFGYIVDNHGFEASGGSQGTNSTLTVSNVSPSITNTTIQLLDTDESGDLTLATAQGETESFKVKFTVTDNNSCQNLSSDDEIASALINVRMSEVAQGDCDADGEDDANDCYANAQNDDPQGCSQDAGSCSGTSDTEVTWTCEFGLQYHADPTTGTPTPPKDGYNWTVAVQATDDDSADTGLVDDNDGNELGLFTSFSFTEASIAYGGPLAPEAESSDKTLTISATGNVGLDEEVSGDDMCTDYPTCSGGTIDVDQQKYDLDSGIAWASMDGDGDDGTLSDTAHEVEINCLKTTTTGSPATKILYWKIKIPSGQTSGSYTGQNTFSGVTGEGGEW
jgi:hypothetical protein